MNRWFLVFAGLLLAKSVCAQSPTKIVVITSNERPVKMGTVFPFDFRVLKLDEMDTIEKELGKNLPIDENGALVLVEKRISEIDQQALNNKIMAAYQGLITALRLGIDRYPAIIFDNQFVVYGITDVKTALLKYEQFLERRENQYE